jgi:hypothetical protein
MSLPGKYDIKLTAGDDFQLTVRLLDDGDPIDTSAYTFKAEIRDSYLPSGTLFADFAVTPITGGAIISLTATQTTALQTIRKFVWDFQSASPLIRTWLSGDVIVQGQVTQ